MNNKAFSSLGGYYVVPDEENKKRSSLFVIHLIEFNFNVFWRWTSIRMNVFFVRLSFTAIFYKVLFSSKVVKHKVGTQSA